MKLIGVLPEELVYMIRIFVQKSFSDWRLLSMDFKPWYVPDKYELPKHICLYYITYDQEFEFWFNHDD